jgi:hypothetical protein
MLQALWRAALRLLVTGSLSLNESGCRRLSLRPEASAQVAARS